MPISTIERLSKGQNSWQILNLRLSTPVFNIGCLSLNANQVILYGGHSDSTQNKIYTYTNMDPQQEGTIAQNQ